MELFQDLMKNEKMMTSPMGIAMFNITTCLEVGLVAFLLLYNDQFIQSHSLTGI